MHAQVIHAWIPSPYDKRALKLDKGDIVRITKMCPNGKWEFDMIYFDCQKGAYMKSDVWLILSFLLKPRTMGRCIRWKRRTFSFQARENFGPLIMDSVLNILVKMVPILFKKK